MAVVVRACWYCCRCCCYRCVCRCCFVRGFGCAFFVGNVVIVVCVVLVAFVINVTVCDAVVVYCTLFVVVC